MERFRSGDAFEFRQSTFFIDQSGVVHCIVESSWQAEIVTPATAIGDLDEGEATLQCLMGEAPEFRAAVGDRPIVYELVVDYGMGGILICSRRDGILEWSHGFPLGAG